MNEYDDILNRIVEEFYDTGKLKLSEEIEFDVDNEDFDVESEEEIEIYDDENIPQEEIDYIEEEYGWLTDDEKIKDILRNPPFKYRASIVSRPNYINSYKSKYILTNEIKKGNTDVYSYKNFNEFLDKVNKILDTDVKIKQDTYYEMTGKNLINTKDKFGLSDEQIKAWKDAKILRSIPEKELEERFEKMVKYLKERHVLKKEHTINTNKEDLLQFFGLFKDYRQINSTKPDNHVTMDKLIKKFKDDKNIKFYLEYINNKYVKKPDWGYLKKYFYEIKYIVENGKFSEEGNFKESKNLKKLKELFNKIKEKEYCYIFSNNCELSSSDIEKVMDFFGETYENSFLTKGFKKESKSVESRIHNLGNVDFSFSEKIKSDDFDVDKISNFINKNIEDYLKGKDSITKYDLLADVDIKDEDGNVIIRKNGKVEVKDINNQDSYLSEFLASPVKKTEYGIRNDPEYLKRYNEVIDKVYTFLKEDYEKSVIDKIKDGLSGIIISNNIYVPNKKDNIEFYLSNVGRSNPENQLRIAVRYHINKNNWRNFYKIGDDGILYPLKKKPDIPTKEKRIYETKSKLDNIIETFFDTGKFVF